LHDVAHFSGPSPSLPGSFLALPDSCWFLSSFPMLLPRLSPIPSLIFSDSVFVTSSLPDSSLRLFSQSIVSKSFPVFAASFPVLPCFFPAPPLSCHGPSPFLSGPFPILLVPFLFSPAWRPRRPPAASVFPCFPQLLPCFLTALPCFLIALLALCACLFF